MAPLPQAVARWSVFNVVAAGGFVIQLTVIALLTRIAGWETWIAAAAGVQAALLHNFAGHCRWTWADRPVSGLNQLLSRFWRYELVHLASAAGAVALTAWGVARTGWPPEVVNAAAVGVFSLVNFLASDRLIFPSPGAFRLRPAPLPFEPPLLRRLRRPRRLP